MSGRIVLGIDMDKTLTQGGVHWEEDPKPNTMVIDYVRNLYFSGKYVIIIWTARQWCDAPELIGWLTKYSVPYHAVKMDKGAADLYIDDKSQLPTETNLKNLLENEMKLETW